MTLQRKNEAIELDRAILSLFRELATISLSSLIESPTSDALMVIQLDANASCDL